MVVSDFIVILFGFGAYVAAERADRSLCCASVSPFNQVIDAGCSRLDLAGVKGRRPQPRDISNCIQFLHINGWVTLPVNCDAWNQKAMGGTGGRNG